MRPLFLLIIFLGCGSFSALAQLELQLESGVAYNTSNTVQAPNTPQSLATRFSLTDDFDPKQPRVFIRGQIAYVFNNRHRVQGVVAPLVFTYDPGTENQDILFEYGVFEATETRGRYQFSTYRLTYRYRFIRKLDTQLELGLTGLVRDANIELTQGSQQFDNDDLGFVPLLSVLFRQRLFGETFLAIEGDALVGPQGRAEDIFFGLHGSLIGDVLQWRAGYRFIEGGADVDQVYNFAFIQFLNFGLMAQL